jgi:nucleotide-binding universal stress UspA family protein
MSVKSREEPIAPDARVIFERILVPVDGSNAARSAAGVAIGLARAFHGAVRFVLVVDTPRIVSELTMGTGRDVSDEVARLLPVARQVLDGVARLAAAAGVTAEAELLEGDVVDRVLEDAVAWGADAIVIGTHARPHSLFPTLGSKTHELLRRSTLPVLVCR